VDCHAVPAKGADASTPRTLEPFCAECHRYAGVTIDCFECHTSKPDEAYREGRWRLPGSEPEDRLLGAIRAFLKDGGGQGP
jgi:hypothetical protein